MPVRLSVQSLLRLPDRRSDELASPNHGTKLDKWTPIEKRENELMRERKSQAAIESEREAGPEGRRREAAIPIADPREPTITEGSSRAHSLPPQPWCELCVRGRGTENPHKRVTFERAESTLPVVAFDFCFIKTSGIVPGVTADEGATCFVLLDVDSGYMKAVRAAGKTVTDCLTIESGRRFVEQFFRRRVRLSCDGEPTTLACGARLKELLLESVVLELTPRHDSQANPSERAIRTLEEQVKYFNWILRSEPELSSWRTHACGRG